MKKIIILITMFILSVFSFGASNDFHIGIVTPTETQAKDSIRGAEELINRYGDVKDGGRVVHITFPEDFITNQEETISKFSDLAKDPKMKAIIVAEGIEGTVKAFKKIRETRPDIVLIVNNPHEGPEEISEVSDLVLNLDDVARGYLIVKAAQKMGAKKFMHISFPRHMSYELLSKRRDIMKQAAKDLGMEFISMTTPDPLSKVGIEGTRQFMLKKTPLWIKKYGKDTAFFTTNDGEVKPLIKQVTKYGGYFVEADEPSPTMGYPEALNIKFTDYERGNWPKILDKVEKTAVAKGGAGRLGTWTYSYNFAVAVALGKFAIKIVNKDVNVSDKDALIATLSKETPGAAWRGSNFIDSEGFEEANYYMLYQDTYVLGKGFLHMTDELIPQKYYRIK